MKKILFLFLTIFILTGCTSKTKATIVINGQQMSVKLDNTTLEGTIVAEQITYPFSLSKAGALTIRYPNGYIFFKDKFPEGEVTSNWQYDETAEELGYLDGQLLASAVQNARTGYYETSSIPIIASILIILIGIWFLCAPGSIWWLSMGWRFKDAEPSDSALIVNRIVGGATIFFGFMSFFL